MSDKKNIPARVPDNSGQPPVKTDEPNEGGGLPYPLNDVSTEVKDRVLTAIQTGSGREVWKRDHDKYPLTSAIYELSYKIGDKVTDLANWFRGKDNPQQYVNKVNPKVSPSTMGRPKSMREAAYPTRKRLE